MTCIDIPPLSISYGMTPYDAGVSLVRVIAPNVVALGVTLGVCDNLFDPWKSALVLASTAMVCFSINGLGWTGIDKYDTLQRRVAILGPILDHIYNTGGCLVAASAGVASYSAAQAWITAAAGVAAFTITLFKPLYCASKSLQAASDSTPV